MSLGSTLVVYLLYATPSAGAMIVMAATDQRPAWGADRAEMPSVSPAQDL
jgi:hypothetical protein